MHVKSTQPVSTIYPNTVLNQGFVIDIISLCSARNCAWCSACNCAWCTKLSGFPVQAYLWPSISGTNNTGSKLTVEAHGYGYAWQDGIYQGPLAKVAKGRSTIWGNSTSIRLTSSGCRVKNRCVTTVTGSRTIVARRRCKLHSPRWKSCGRRWLAGANGGTGRMSFRCCRSRTRTNLSLNGAGMRLATPLKATTVRWQQSRMRALRSFLIPPFKPTLGMLASSMS